MAYPVLPTLSEAAADALDGTTDAAQTYAHGTGLIYILHGAGPSDTPKLRTRLTEQTNQIAFLLEAMTQGKVVDAGGVNVGVFPSRFTIAGTVYTYAGSASIALTDDETNYVYLDTGGIDVSIVAFPADSFHLAVVVCASGDISSVTDARFDNFQTGITNAWSTVAAAQNVDMGGFGLEDLGYTELTAPTELTVAAGVITPTQEWHTVDGEGDAADSITTITAGAGTVGRFLLLQLENTLRSITIESGGNIDLIPIYGSDHLMQTYSDGMRLFQYSATRWMELHRYDPTIASPGVDMDFNTSYGITRLGTLNLSDIGTRTIAAGVAITTKTVVKVATEAGAATDDLDSITGGVTGDLLLLTPNDSGDTVVVKHAVGADKFLLVYDLDYSMGIVGGGGTDATRYWLLCIHNGTQWVEVARSHWEPKSMIIASAKERDSIPYSPGSFEIEGAIVAGVWFKELTAVEAFVIKSMSGHVGTAPSGGSCVVDTQVNGASIHANDADRILITDGTTTDTSADEWHEVSKGDLIRIEITATDSSPNGAEDLTVTINGRIGCKDVSP